MNYQEKREELARKSAELKKFIDDNPIETMTADQVAEFRKRNDEMGPLADEVKSLSEAIDLDKKNRERHDELTKPVSGRPTMADGTVPSVKTDERGREDAWAKALDDNDDMKRLREGKGTSAQFQLSKAEFKNTVTLTNWNNEPTRLPKLVPSAQEERTVRDLALQGTTDNNSITFMEETTFTNSAAGVLEAGAKPESVLNFTKRTILVEKVATFIQTTKEMLDDIPAFNSYVRERMMFMVKRAEEVLLLTGTGTSPQIRGYLNATGIQTQAKGADPGFDAIYKAITLVRNTGFAEPNGIVMHPTDWQNIRLTRTADGIYILGSPYEQIAERVWGLPVRVTTAETLGTALVGAFSPMSQVFEREGVVVTISTEHASNFVSNIVTVLAEERLALAIYRGAAFAKVTGL